MRIPKVLSTLAAVAVAGTLTLGLTATPAFASIKPVIPQCHNDTHLPNHFVNGSPLGGDPNIGLLPNGGYYYDDIVACSTSAVFELDDPAPSCWVFNVYAGPDHNSPQLVHFKVMHAFTYTMTGLTPGHVYAFRVANLENFVVTDHSSVTS